MRRWRGALVLLCAVAEEALDIPGVEVVRVAPLPPAAPSPEAAAYAATLVNVSLELQLAGGALVQLSASAWDAASREAALAEVCRGYDAAGCAQAEVVLATRAAAARWAHASVGRGADHSFWPPFFNYEGGSGSPAALFTYHLLPGADGRAPVFALPAGPRKLLEVGSFEGGAAMWFAEHLLADARSRLFCVDAWTAEVYVDEDNSHAERLRRGLADGPDRWRRNLGRTPHGDRVLGLKATDSVTALAGLAAAGHENTFDLAYIDGGHRAAEAFADATLALPLLRPGAFLAFDDYGFGPTKRGVDAFLAANGARVEVLWRGTMLFARVS